jgi:Ca2+-binding RTX toxin-like protein
VLELECTDSGPEYERTDVNGFVVANGEPLNGDLSDANPTANPSTVVYTPERGFTGSDRVVYSAFDAFGFGTDEGTISVEVSERPDPAVEPGGGGRPSGGGGAGGSPPRCAGREATITGTKGNDVLQGTDGDDVIVAGAGRDTIRAGRGNDVICGGAGNDRIDAERGNDRVLAGAGDDRVSGGRRTDRLDGGAGRDRLHGGRGRDTCRQGPRLVACER